MPKVTITEARSRLAALARRAEEGEIVTITRGGKPIADIVPHRAGGGVDFERGQAFLKSEGIDRIFTHVSDDLDDPLPEDFLLRPLPK